MTIVVVMAETGPKVLPIKVMNEPVDGIERENSASVLPSRAMAIAATMMVSGEAMPAVDTSSAELKKKLIAGAMLAMVDAAISTRPRAPRCRRGAAAVRTSLPSEGINPGDSSCVLMEGHLLRARRLLEGRVNGFLSTYCNIQARNYTRYSRARQ